MHRLPATVVSAVVVVVDTGSVELVTTEDEEGEFVVV
jgi:hypothetical protein